MKVIKRSGIEDEFDEKKIQKAIVRANKSVPEAERMNDLTIHLIVNAVIEECKMKKHAPSVEEVQDMVENHIMEKNAFNVARNYITYRYKHAVLRKSNSTDKQILSLLECNNEEVKQENSNKNPVVNSAAYAQLLSCQLRGYAAERNGNQ